MYSAVTPGAGYRWALQLGGGATGILGGMHYELNGNDQAGSCDLMLDTDVKGLCVVGSNHFQSGATGGKWCIEDTGNDNSFEGVTWSSNIVHTVDYVINAVNAHHCHIGSIRSLNTPQAPIS